MNKSEPGKRLAKRRGITGTPAKYAVDGVFEPIGEALANG